MNKNYNRIECISEELRKIATVDVEESKQFISKGLVSDNLVKIISIEESIQKDLLTISEKLNKILK